MGKGLRSPARDALIVQVTPIESYGRAFGFHRAADHFGAVAGSLAAWLLLFAGLRGSVGDRVERCAGRVGFAGADAGPVSSSHRLIVSKSIILVRRSRLPIRRSAEPPSSGFRSAP